MPEQTPDEIFDDASGDLAIGDWTARSRSTGNACSLIPIFLTAGTRSEWR
jgi:hypothetical protein